jgi:hypothetical protein
MFPHYELADTLRVDRQTRFRNAAARRRLGRRAKAAPSQAAPTLTASFVRPDDPDRVFATQRVHCAA